MKKRLSIWFFTIACIFGLSAFMTGNDPFANLLKKLDEFSQKYPLEKVYLHLDKPYYAIGDDIWFKAYVVDGRSAMPSDISNSLYVELINDRDSVVKQLKLSIQDGVTWGDFKLSDSLNEGNYRIRSYTQWMRNAGEDFFFDKTIKIGNGWANKVLTKSTFTYSTNNNRELVNANIKFANLADEPFTNTEVRYQVVFGNKKTSSTKVTTDAKGEININLANAKTNEIKSGTIIATIILPDKQKIIKEIPIKATSNTVDVQFFPEGGSLIEGLPCKVAVKAVNASGLGEAVSGTVIDNNGNEESAFQAIHLGMGSFFITPQPGETYSAKVKFADRSEKLIALPQIKTSGYALAVNNLDSAKMSVKVMLTTDLLNRGTLNLVAQHNGNLYFATKVPTEKQIVSVVAPKGEFPSGITQLTLFDEENTPVSERIIFINNIKDKIELKIPELRSTYAKKKKVDLLLQVTHEGRPTSGNFSVSVTNASVVTPDPDNESNIYTSLLLTSDLVGYVEKPNQYFIKDNLETKANLDLLMLTQGWRKIDWKKIELGQFPAITYEPEKTLKISGRITRGGKPLTKAIVVLFSNSPSFLKVDTLNDKDGHFVFNDLKFTEGSKFVVQAKTDKGNKNVHVDIDTVPGQTVTTNKNTGDIEVNVNETLKSYVRQSEDYFNELVRLGRLNHSIILKEVEIREKKLDYTKYSANLNGPGRADAVFTSKDMEKANSLLYFLGSSISGVGIRSGTIVSMRTSPPMPLAIVLNGQIMSDYKVEDILIENVESVEVLMSTGYKAIYGPPGGAGLLIITTKKGNIVNTNEIQYSPGIAIYAPKGYYQVREFYSPKYDVEPGANSNPDLRTTVYWNPKVIADQTGKANINYFNTDQPGNYRIVVEGIDDTGNLVHNAYNYQVK